MNSEEADDLTDDCDVMAHRERVAVRLDEIAQQARETLAVAGLDIPLFFTLPSTGQAILNVGTLLDPDDATWRRVGEIVRAIIARVIGVDRLRSREMPCASTHTLVDHQPCPTAVQLGE